jgi:hypothetical protein
VISSATTANGTVGQAFSYQIAASNSPTSFAAANLPTGLSVNSATGLISGTPTTAGTTNSTLSATNATGTGNATLQISITSSGGGGGNYAVNFEDASKDAYASDNVTLGGISWNLSDTLIKGDASDFFLGTKSARLRGYSTSSLTMLADKSGGIGIISLQHRRYGTDSQIEWIVEYSMNSGTSWTPAGRFTANATESTFTAAVNQAGQGRIRIRTEASGSSNRRTNIDNILVTDASAATPLLTTNGTLTALSTTYGNSSASTSFVVSGTNMTSGILVSAPAGFEVSQTAGGASGYAATQTVGASGTIAATTVYLRLAATTAAETYSGIVTCSSTGATSASLSVPASTIRPRLLTVTATDRTKPFGNTLTLGTSAFTSSGLSSNESIGSVTLTASGGTDAYATTGTYEITPSAATGGTFNISNYDLYYVSGILSVTAPTFSEWASGLSNATATADPDADGLPNLLEYFMGLNATATDYAPQRAVMIGSDLTLDYRRSKGQSGLTGAVEWTTSLTTNATWSSANVTDSLLIDQGAYENRRATVPVLSGESKKFLRLRINPNP